MNVTKGLGPRIGCEYGLDNLHLGRIMMTMAVIYRRLSFKVKHMHLWHPCVTIY